MISPVYVNIKSTTPKFVRGDVKTFCAELGGGEVYVIVKPDEEASYGNCNLNVKAKVQREGGSIVHGWCIWHQKRLLVEGEFHAVWRSPEGKLLCVTPHVDGEKKILFVPAPKYGEDFDFTKRPENVKKSLAPFTQSNKSKMCIE